MLNQNILAQKHHLHICGGDTDSAPIVAILHMQFNVPGSPSSREQGEKSLLSRCGISNTGTIQTIRTSSKQITHHALDKRSTDRTCTIDFEDVESFDPQDRHSMHYHGFAVYESGPTAFNIATVVYVVREKHWEVVKEVVRSSARTFEVNWDAFNRRFMHDSP